MGDDAPDEVIDDALVDFLEEFATPTSLRGICAGAQDDDDERPPELVPFDIVASEAEEDWVLDAARSVRHNGFCVLRAASDARDGLVPSDITEPCARSAATRLSALLELALAAGHARPRREVLRYSEVCSRTAGGMRFDVRLPEPDAGGGGGGGGGAGGGGATDASAGAASRLDVPSCWAELRADVARWVIPVLSRARQPAEGGAGRDESAVRADSAGFVTSLAGAPDQHFHPDGTAAGLVNVFCPLRDVDFCNGPTELRPGSHVWRESEWGSEPAWDERAQLPVAPALRAGELLLFDYRCYHRGLANRSDEPRPVAYVVFAMRPGVADAHNFPRERLVDAAAAATAT